MNSVGRIVVEASIFWAIAGTVAGWSAVRIPDTWLDHDSWLTRIRSAERGGRVYRRSVQVHRWKDRLPEGGAIFAAGRSKRSLPDGDRLAALNLFAAETRRAEWVHWSQIALAPTFVWWQPLNVSVVMVLVIGAAHAPFIVVQRYNRARVLRILDRKRPREHLPVASTPVVRFTQS